MKSEISIIESPKGKENYRWSEMVTTKGIFKCINDPTGWKDNRLYLSEGGWRGEDNLMAITSDGVCVFQGHKTPEDKKFWLEKAVFIVWRGKINLTLEN